MACEARGHGLSARRYDRLRRSHQKNLETEEMETRPEAAVGGRSWVEPEPSKPLKQSVVGFDPRGHRP